MTSSGAEAETLAHFFYRSLACEGMDASMLRDILEVARARNAAGGLTGCLHYEDGMFFQWLEGGAAALAPVVASIRADARHRGLTVLGEGPLAARHHAGWDMRLTGGSGGSLLGWLADRGISTLHPREYAEAVQSFLRQPLPGWH